MQSTPTNSLEGFSLLEHHHLHPNQSLGYANMSRAHLCILEALNVSHALTSSKHARTAAPTDCLLCLTAPNKFGQAMHRAITSGIDLIVRSSRRCGAAELWPHHSTSSWLMLGRLHHQHTGSPVRLTTTCSSAPEAYESSGRSCAQPDLRSGPCRQQLYHSCSSTTFAAPFRLPQATQAQIGQYVFRSA